MRLSVLRAPAAVACFLTAPAWALVPAPCDSVSFAADLLPGTGGFADLDGLAGCKGGELFGHVDYFDHHFRLHMRSIEITAYLFDPAAPNARDICGIGMVNGDDRPVRFRMRVQDNGHPGDRDLAGIVIDPTPEGRVTVSTRPLVSGFPGGGNIQLHAGTSAPAGTGFFAPDEAQACGGLPPP